MPFSGIMGFFDATLYSSMTDTAFDMLCAALNQDDRDLILWVVDENLSADQIDRVVAKPPLHAITNRVDIAARLRERGIATELSDFEFQAFAPQSVDAVYFRIGKEKAIVHHVINRVPELVSGGGQLILAGAKNEGIKTYSDKARALLGGRIDKQRGRGSTLLSKIAIGDHTGAPLDDRDYRTTIALRAIDPLGEEIELISKPGVYGWNKIDRGSERLAAQLPAVLSGLTPSPEVIVDLGCGYGYLSVMAARLTTAALIATDNNVVAVEMCRQNFAKYRVSGEVVPADCGDGIEQCADLVLCNPPFHQGFSTGGDLTERFVAAAKRLLKPGGAAFFVVNSFIPLERVSRGVFSSLDTVANDGQFKLILLR